MTPQEHEMMLLMFTRMNEAIGIVVEALKSRDLWTAEDVKAFSHATHYDNQKLLSYLLQARVDYLKCAKQAGVVTGLES
jgi:hypothetical protein